ncbi:helix-turn-helix domain-containing protein [Daejeonella sp. JGW-45]|uniref:helix-turn-helix domain-containing protein n=1 Tax=Daejeonella sp. JGW-45 TaxID=3034148 RepID=UPI003204E0C2
MIQIEIISKEDLQQFKNELIEEIRSIIKTEQSETKQWLRSKDVRKMLKISPGTLQTLRINGTLPFTKVGSIMFYKHEDIVRLLDNK